MTMPDLTAALAVRGVRLTARLVVDAPAGVLTPELRESLIAHKSRLLQRVVREMVWATLSPQPWGPRFNETTAGIDNPGRPFDPETFAGALAADPYAVAEREAIQAENTPAGGVD